MMKKKKWGKPKLIILTRGKPEEGVLMQCKMTWLSGSGGGAWACVSSHDSVGCVWCYNNAVTS
ncbi:hypothetical protein EPN54_04245 [bacterium]|nr:MAG: hypothetical protein EPN54_04245 [bacterium]